MNRFFQSASVAALALMLSGGALAAPEEIQSISATIAPPADSGSGTPVPPIQTEQANPTLTEQAKPALSAEDMAVAEKLRDLIENKLRQHVTREQDRAGVETFYRDRGFAPLWVRSNAPLPRAKEVIAFLRGVGADGLDPDDYPTPAFADSSPDKLAADELRLTNSVLTFARHASTGRVAFSRVSGSVYFDLKSPDAANVLAKLAAATNVRDTLDSFNPQHPAYQALKAQLAAARQPATGRTEHIHVPEGPILRPSMNDARVPILRKRLNVADSNSPRYDDEIVAAVKRFQEQSELNPDGSVGPNTVAKLNGESRLDQTDSIIANLERWRWLPHDLGETYAMVNVPDYTLKVVDRGKTVWSTRIVVGKPGKYSTPLLTETMKYITVNPTWNVPPSIIRNEYLPALQQDPGALARIGLRMGRNADGSLRIYQPPGEKNALGRLRFNFPNRFLVYQHDTPDKTLFEKTARAYSHGCMRVQNPDQYAETLLSITQPEDNYTIARIHSFYGHGERTINLKKQIPVYITYQTAFVDDAGQLLTRADIYGLDKEIASVLHDERRIADVPVARNYSSGSKPVMAQIPSRRADYDGFASNGFTSDGWGSNSEPSPWQSSRRPFDRFKSW